MRFYPRYHSRQTTEEGRGLDAYVVIDASTNEPVTPPLPYHTANDYAGMRNNPTQTDEPIDLYAGLQFNWAGLFSLPVTP